jgi:short-subunit dehydrogenase
MSEFTNRVVLITGAGNGIGRELAHVLAAEGARVAALDRDGTALESLAAELKDRAVATAVADVTDLAAVRAAAGELEARLGPTELLIANAGVGIETSALAFRAEEIAAQVNVNLIGVANSIDAVLPGMVRRRSGHLVAISSLASYRGLPRMAGYCASKAGVNALLDALRVELRPAGIAVTTVCPGWVRTGLTATLDLRHVRMMELAEAVRRVVEAVRTRKAFVAFPAPDAWRVRLLRHLPRSASDWMTARHFRRLLKP